MLVLDASRILNNDCDAVSLSFCLFCRWSAYVLCEILLIGHISGRSDIWLLYGVGLVCLLAFRDVCSFTPKVLDLSEWVYTWEDEEIHLGTAVSASEDV